MFGLFCIFTLTDDGKIIFLIKRNIFIILPIIFVFDALVIICHEKNLPQTIEGNQFLLMSTVINIHDVKN